MKQTDIHIRAAADVDMEEVQQIYAAEVERFTASFEEVAPTVDEMKARRAAILAAGCRFLVAVRSGKVVGFAYSGPYRTRSAYRFTVESTVYVAPSAQRAGVARRLMMRLITECEQAGFRQMIAVIGDENAASVAFHAAIGFSFAGKLERVGFKFGRWLDTTTMQRSLGPPIRNDRSRSGQDR